MIHNPNFKVVEFDHFRMQAGLPSFVMSVGEWIEKTNAIGIIVKKGRYGGALFRETTGNTLEPSAADRIWELILDTILEIAEIISADASELLSAVIHGNPKFHKLYQMYKLVVL